MMADATTFPDLFVNTLLAQLQTGMANFTDTPSINYFTRPLRPQDPNASVCVFETDVMPVEYEIGGELGSPGNAGPSVLRWNVAVQVLIKAGEEQEGRALRSTLLHRVRNTLFSDSCTTALMILNDTVTREHVSRFRMTRIAYASGDSAEARAKFFIGQMELYFDTLYGS